MKKLMPFLLMGSVVLSLQGALSLSPAWSAELDGFTIDTQDKTVTITLFTDQKVPYSLEHVGKQMTIVLSGTQLSQEQLNNGLPVVIDNKNCFIGRAVPAEDGKIKIILPNLPANEYTVSVIQRRSVPTLSVAAAPIPTSDAQTGSIFAQPASADHFEQVATRLSASEREHEKARRKTQASHPHQPARFAGDRAASRGSMLWNPYVIGQEERPAVLNVTPRNGRAATPLPSGPVNALALADATAPGWKISSGFGSHPRTGADLNGSGPGSGLDHLHALTSIPTGPHETEVPAGPADPKDAKTISAVTPAATESAPQAASNAKAPDAPTSHEKSDAKQGGFTLPWFWILVALVIGGVGVVGLIGGLFLLRWMMIQGRWPIQFPVSGPQTHAPPPEQAPAPVSTPNGASYTDMPPDAFLNPVFQDRASIRSQDYLKDMPDSIEQAVRNAVPQTFISRKKPRNASIRIPRQPENGTTA